MGQPKSANFFVFREKHETPWRWAMNKILKAHPKPWVICQVGTNSKAQIIQRYVNRSDADDALRFLCKATGTVGQFVVAFDVVETNETLTH
jgi:hypothetical protein